MSFKTFGLIGLGCLLIMFTRGYFVSAQDNTLPTKGNVMNVHSFTAKAIDGADQDMAQYKGKALLLVNTASLCGYTPQYASLEALYEKYGARGFEILAFPANNFGSQEPGENHEIKQFCAAKFNVTFPLFAKISVKGDDIHPLYQYLTTASGFNGPIKWNFNKFLVDADGRVVARYDSKVDPMSAEITDALEKILPR